MPQHHNPMPTATPLPTSLRSAQTSKNVSSLDVVYSYAIHFVIEFISEGIGGSRDDYSLIVYFFSIVAI